MNKKSTKEDKNLDNKKLIKTSTIELNNTCILKTDIIANINAFLKINASIYSEILNPKFVTCSKERDYAFDTFHTFVIQVDQRDVLKDFLASEGIGTSIQYPIPIHLQPAASRLNLSEGTFPVTEKQSKRILTLPVNQYISEEEIDLIAKKVNYFFEASVNG